jgi:hypothetical protein
MIVDACDSVGRRAKTVHVRKNIENGWKESPQ